MGDNNYDYDSFAPSDDEKEDTEQNKDKNDSEKKAIKQNLTRGVLVGLGGSIRSIVIPYLIFSQVLSPDGFLSSMLADMLGGEGGGDAQLFGTPGNIDAMLFYIIWLGIVSVSIKWAKAYSPKRSGSIRRGVLALMGTAIRIPGLFILIQTGCSVLFLNMVGMVELTIDLTPYIIVLMGFVVFRLIPQAYELLESFVIHWKMNKEDEEEGEKAEEKEESVSFTYDDEEEEDSEKTSILDSTMDNLGEEEEF